MSHSSALVASVSGTTQNLVDGRVPKFDGRAALKP
jgi:hypothetical protein